MRVCAWAGVRAAAWVWRVANRATAHTAVTSVTRAPHRRAPKWLVRLEHGGYRTVAAEAEAAGGKGKLHKVRVLVGKDSGKSKEAHEIVLDCQEPGCDGRSTRDARWE